jgi:glycosyltransferase involved in cell wall biosynthesis
MHAPIAIVTDLPLPGPGLDATRALHRASLLASRGGGVVIAPAGPEGPITTPGILHRTVEVAPGLSADRRAEAVTEQVGPLLDRIRPSVVHAFGVPLAVPALLRARGGVRTVVEPGVTPSQLLRDLQPDTPAVRLADLVELEEKTLARADAVVARSPVEAATLVKRGVPTDRIWTARDGLPARDEVEDAPSELPQIVMVGDLAPWSGWELLLTALARIKLPWRLTILLPSETSGAPITLRARALRLESRVRVVVDEPDVAVRVAGGQLVVCPIVPTRAVLAGSVVPEGALWALACRRPLIAADVPVVRAYAGAAARYFEAANAGALATALRAALGEPDLRAELVERGAEVRQTLAGDEADRTVLDLWNHLGAAG